MNPIRHKKVVVNRFGGPEALAVIDTETCGRPESLAAIRALVAEIDGDRNRQSIEPQSSKEPGR